MRHPFFKEKMKKSLYFLTIALLLPIISYCQLKQFDYKLVKQSDKPTRIFITAIWCSPCMGKYKKIIPTLKTDTVYNNYIIFDASGFTIEKLRRIEENYFDIDKSYFIPYEFYKTRGPITFNLPEKALKRFKNNLIQKMNSSSNLDKLWYGDLISIDKSNISIVDLSTLKLDL